jgi:PPOX class probable F420-dependent enzyme
VPLLDYRDPKHVHAEERLGTELIAWLTTAGSDGQPQSTPVWFLWDGHTLLVYSRPKSRKLRNIAANAHVSLHLEGDRTGGENVIFEGEASLPTNAPPADRVPEYMEKYRGQIDEYGWTPASFAADYSVALRIEPKRVRIW